MTKMFQKIILLVAIIFGGMLNASCPPNYTTSTLTLDNVTFNVCYPSIVNLNVNSGEFNIYVSVTNNNGTSRELTVEGYLPALVGLNTLINSGCPPTVATPTCDGTTIVGNGKGRFVYPSGTPLGAGLTTTLKATMQAITAGSYTYIPQGIVQPTFSGSLPAITITVVNTPCSTIIASNGVSATACSNSVISGDLNNFVTGGSSPYSFDVANAINGTVGLADNIYTFDPNITSGNGTFDYQAFDIPGCPSNTGTITVPVVSSPVGGNDAFYTTTFGTPVVQQLNFTGGTAPFTITTNNIVNGSVGYDSNTAQFTFTQTAPGASFFDYTVTDANGCSANATPNIYIYSCNPGYTVSAKLSNNAIYAICAPSAVILGNTFQITTTIVNPNVIGSATTAFPVQDLVPDPSQVSFAPGLVYTGNTGIPSGTSFDPLLPSFINQGGKGQFEIQTSLIAPGEQFAITQDIQATISGAQTYTARILSNPNLTLTVNINVVICPTITAGSTGTISCANEVTGTLEGLVNGGSGPYTFFGTGTPSCGEVTISPSGVYTYTAPIGFTGICSFDYFATDINTCPSPSGTVSVIANLAPVAADAEITLCENGAFIGGELLGLVTGGVPPYKDFTIVMNGTLGTATITNSTTGSFNYIPNPDTFGNDSFTFQATDSGSQGCVSNIATISVTIKAGPIASNSGIAGCGNSPIIGDLSTLVTSGTPPYDFTGNGFQVGGQVAIGLTGPYIFTPNNGFSGLGGFGYLVTDFAGCSATGTVDITISTPIIAPSGISLCSDISAAGNLTDQVSGGVLPYAFGPTGTSVGGTVNIQSAGSYVFTPTPGFQGQASFDYQVVDGGGCIAVGSLDITYTNPVASAGTASTCENSSLIGASLSATAGTPPYTFAIITNGVNGTATITDAMNGTFNYVPNPGFSGIDNFTFQVTDFNGCLSNIAAFQITVSQKPITQNGTGIDCVNTALNGSLTGLVSGGTVPYVFSLTGTPFGGNASVNASGTFTFNPSEGFSGPAGFVYQVVDNVGCSATGEFDIEVASPIASPTAANACFQSPINGNLSSLVTGGFPGYVFGLTGSSVGGVAAVDNAGVYNFAPATGFSGLGGFVYQVTDTNNCIATAPVSVTVDSLVALNLDAVSCTDTYAGLLTDFVTGGTGALLFTGPLSISCGSVTILPDGNFLYTGPEGFTGPCDFVYQVFDGINCSSTGVVTVSANTATTVNDGALVTCQDVAVSDSLATLLNSMPQPPLTFVIVTQPTQGTLTSFNATTGTYTYTPNVGFSGADSFQFQVTDSSVPPCTTNVGTVNITVNEAPVAAAGTVTICFGASATGSLAPFVSGGATPYNFVQVGTGVNGVATVQANGDYTFVPTSGFIGQGSFQYQVIDDNGCVSNVATFVVIVQICCPFSDDPFMQYILEQYWGLTGL